jgi:hypothetical protein
MTPLETYLKTATRGLWGKKKLEVREELENHVLEQAHKHELLGMTREDATRKTIQELGSPHTLNQGMKGVYVMPQLIRSSVALIALITCIIVTMPRSTAQVSVMTSIRDLHNIFDVTWLNVESLATTLKNAGATLTQEGKHYRVTFPEGSQVVITSTWTKNNQSFESASQFLNSLETTKLPISLSGFDNPKVTIGKTSFTLGTAEQTVRGDYFYGWRLMDMISLHQPVSNMAFDMPVFACCTQSNGLATTQLSPEFKHLIPINAAVGSVFGLVSGTEKPFSKSLRFAIGKVIKPGVLELNTSHQKLKFSESMFDVYTPDQNGRIRAALLLLTGPYQWGGGLTAPVAQQPKTSTSDAVR